ncbi:helix-turn-helix domain-containing protein [Butyrivibrio sp. VCD2006]|uniref:helix-turn-helix domain-containing protein n=1 Tax=Butyrivibrio sp. VCD2006 TaxID=1280664 RepID=UPI000429AA03|nr:helix-turn-helix transcriptional regulator [Butyrivibrio sp. VCD2006]
MENIIDYKKVGARIHDARKKCGYTQEQLAELTDMSATHVSHIETGSTKIGLPALVRVSNTLTVTIDSLLQDSSDLRFDAYMDALSQILKNCNDKKSQAIINIATTIRDLDNDDISIEQ